MLHVDHDSLGILVRCIIDRYKNQENIKYS